MSNPFYLFNWQIKYIQTKKENHCITYFKKAHIYQAIITHKNQRKLDITVDHNIYIDATLQWLTEISN